MNDGFLSRVLSYSKPEDPLLARTIIKIIESLSGKRQAEQIYLRARAEVEQGSASFWQAALKELQVRSLLNGEEYLSRVPDSGPVLLIANHPFGIVDGLLACDIAARLRPKFSVLVNQALIGDPLIAEYFLPIDFSGRAGADRENAKSRKMALQRLFKGECVVLFPGGGVATRRKGIGVVEELPWGPLLAKMVRQSQATVLPLYFDGTNSRLFHLLSQVHPNLRFAMFLRETIRLRGKQVGVTIRSPLPFSTLQTVTSKKEMIQLLYNATFGHTEVR